MYVLQDWQANKYSFKGRAILFLFRLFSLLNSKKITKILFYPLMFIYRIIVEWTFGIEINLNAKLGKIFKLFHEQSLVINRTSIIGEDCLFRNNITIGSKILEDGYNTKAVTLENNVEVGSNSVIIGNIKIGNNVIIGAGSVVIKDIPNNAIVAANPAKIIKYRNN